MKRGKGFVLKVFAALVALGMVVVMGASAQTPTKPIKLRFAGAFPPPEVSMMGEVVKTWQEEVTKRTKGAITFENHWGAALGAPAEHIELLSKGTVQVANLHQWYTPGKMPLGDFEYVFPFGPTDYELVVKAMRKMRSEFPQFAEELAGQNAIMIADLPFGVYDFMSKKPLKKIDDFKGEKVSLIGRYFGRWLPPGATAVVRPGHERYDLLRSGVVSTDSLPFDLFYSFKIHEQTKYYIKVNLISCLAAPILMNLDTFKSFSPEIQKILLEIGKEVELKAAKEIIPKWWDKCVKEWKAKGIIFIDFPEEEKQKWAATLEDLPAEWAAEVEGKGLPGFKIVERWQEITKELGFKWARKWGVKK